MAPQFDLQIGFDPTTVAQPTAAQIAQMVAAAGPLGNIGFVLFQATPPDVVNNPRFARYFWLDTSVLVNGVTPGILKTWNGAAWVAGPIGTGTIITTALKNPRTSGDVINGGVPISYLKNKDDGSANQPDAGKILIVDAQGQFVEIESFSNLQSLNKINPSNLDRGSAQELWVLQIKNQVPLFAPFDSFSIPFDSIGVQQLAAPDFPGYVIRSNPTTGVPEWANPTGLLDTGSITLDKLGANSLSGTNGSANQVVKKDSNGATKWTDPVINYIDDYIVGNPIQNNTGILTKALNRTPSKIISLSLYVKCVVTDTSNGYSKDDILSVECFSSIAGVSSVAHPPFSVCISGSNIVYISRILSTGLQLIKNIASPVLVTLNGNASTIANSMERYELHAVVVSL